MSLDHETMLDRLARGARDAAARHGNAEEDLVTRALLVSRARGRRRRMWIRGGAYAALMVVALLAFLRAREPAPIATAPIVAPAPTPMLVLPTETALATGDRVLSFPSTSMAVSALSADERSLVLSSGEALFDVRSGAPFIVQTPSARVRVLGTVFRVHVFADHTYVRVYEGRVEVVSGDTTRILAAGQTFGDASATPSSLDIYGDAFARARAMLAVVQSAPSAAPATTQVAAAPSAPALEERTPRSSPELTIPVSLEQAREMLSRGEYQSVLDAVDAATNAERSSDWMLLFADAHRGLGHAEQAADAFDRAASLSTPTHAAVAGLSAARVRLAALQDAQGALRSLDRARSDAPGSAVEDPAMALRVRALRSLSRDDDARAAARIYVARFPSGSAASELQAWLAQP